MRRHAARDWSGRADLPRSIRTIISLTAGGRPADAAGANPVIELGNHREDVYDQRASGWSPDPAESDPAGAYNTDGRCGQQHRFSFGSGSGADIGDTGAVDLR